MTSGPVFRNALPLQSMLLEYRIEQVLAERRVAPPASRAPELERRRAERVAPPKAPRRWPYVVGVVILALLATNVWWKNRANRLEAENRKAIETQQREEHERRARQLAAHRAREEAERALAAARNEPVQAAPALAAPAPSREPASAPMAAAPATSAAAPESEALRRFRDQAIAEFKSADVNRDGYLSIEEARNRFPYLAKEFARVDRNGDGRISQEEFLQAKRLLLEKRFGK